MKPRRFEMGASGFGYDDFLKKLGYIIWVKSSTLFRVIGPNGGRPRHVSRRELFKILDDERIKAGLEPIIKRGTE